MGREKKEYIEIRSIKKKIAIVTIVGDTDIILNKMNDVTTRTLTMQRKNKAKDIEKPNEWEEIMTSIHWLKEKPKTFSAEEMDKKLSTDSPCITAFGLKKSFMDAVVRNGIDKYSTKFKANVNVIGECDNKIPIKFTEWHKDEKLICPKKGSPVLAKLNRFSGWSAEFKIEYLDSDGSFSLEQILNIINLAGFGGGIGSGRSSDYGRFHIENVVG